MQRQKPDGRFDPPVSECVAGGGTGAASHYDKTQDRQGRVPCPSAAGACGPHEGRGETCRHDRADTVPERLPVGEVFPNIRRHWPFGGGSSRTGAGVSTGQAGAAWLIGAGNLRVCAHQPCGDRSMDIALVLVILAFPFLVWRAWVGLGMPKRRAERQARRHALENRLKSEQKTS